MSLDAVRTAYAARSAEYIALFGCVDQVAEVDRDFILTWALGLQGPVLDVGCGPGQWTHLLSAAGVDTEGVDPVPEFVDSARANYPSDRYQVGRAEDLGVDDAALAGVLGLVLAHPHRTRGDRRSVGRVRALRLARWRAGTRLLLRRTT